MLALITLLGGRIKEPKRTPSEVMSQIQTTEGKKWKGACKREEKNKGKTLLWWGVVDNILGHPRAWVKMSSIPNKNPIEFW